ncbi:MAG: hypothetical protein K8E66_11240 [Phycisphaerales bacterium]|nr:hypothetical protein [Phycisphaerales bacterium]
MQHTRVFAAALGVSAAVAGAANVPAGDDLIETLPETWFNFGPGIGVVNFIGDPLDPGTLGATDTIVRRLQDTQFNGQGVHAWDGPPQPGTTDTIDIELVALSLRSVAPIDIGGAMFNVDIDLDPAIASVGTMTLRHEWNDAGQFQGTFDSMLTIFADALFTPVGGGPGSFAVDIDNLALSSTNTLWAHHPFFGFYFPQVEESHPGVGVHTGTIIPTQGVAVVIGVGALTIATRRRRA